MNHDRVLADAEPVGNLAVAEAFELVQQQHFALPGRQLADGPLEMTDPVFRKQGTLLTGRSVDDRDGEGLGTCTGPSRLVAIVIGEKVRRYAVEIGAGIVDQTLRPPADQPNEGLLGQIGRGFGAFQPSGQIALKLLPVLPIEVLNIA